MTGWKTGLGRRYQVGSREALTMTLVSPHDSPSLCSPAVPLFMEWMKAMGHA